MERQLDFDGELSARECPPVRLSGDEVILVAAEVAALLRVTTAWAYAETRANRLPHVRLGRYVRYRESAIRAWLAEEENRISQERRG
jgi:excisionase family DNA binding protein